MRTAFDFSPMFRSSVGFDRIFDLLENANRVQAIDTWPPYDIVKTDEDHYRISMAVAGFSQDELNVTVEPNLLVVSGTKSGDKNGEYLYRGIGMRPFERRFELADHVKVTSASLDDGILTVDLVREIPEAMKPRRIAIGTGTSLPKSEQKRIGQDKQAA